MNPGEFRLIEVLVLFVLVLLLYLWVVAQLTRNRKDALKHAEEQKRLTAPKKEYETHFDEFDLDRLIHEHEVLREIEHEKKLKQNEQK